MTISTETEPTADELRRTVAGIIEADPEDIADDDNLVFLGLGSLEVMRLVTRWRRSGLEVDFAELAAEPTVAAWTRQLAAAWAAGR